MSKKRTKQRVKRTTPHTGRAIIKTLISLTPDEITAYHNLGVAFHQMGREDKASGKAAVTYKAFAAAFMLGKDRFPNDYPSTIAKAQYSTQYMAGYANKDYQDIEFKKIIV